MPKVFVSYSHDTREHKDRVLALSDRLRDDGVECYIDQYEQSPDVGWATWCEQQVEEAAMVLVVCTETYLRRFQKKEKPQVGKGVTWEGLTITQELYDAQGRNEKFIPITFSPNDAAFVPTPLKSTTRYDLPDGYEDLYRRLTRQPSVTAPPMGAVKAMPARERAAPLPMLQRKQDPIWNLTHRRNPAFTGREKILADIQAALSNGKNVALSGIGGVGKTGTAVEYAYRHRSEYEAVLWVKAEERNTLLSDFAALATALHLPSADAKEQETSVTEVRHWLDSHSGWLLILDNADDLDLAKEFLPADGQGHVILTTRAHAMKGLAERIDISAMQPEEGAQLLLKRTGQTDKALAIKLSQELGGLPLALDQAGAYIEETPSNLKEYLDLYSSEKLKLLGERGGSLGDHPSVTVTFSLAFEKVAAESSDAADIVRLCAFLAPDGIPEIIFTATDRLAFAKLLKEAGRFSLIQRDPENKTLSIHRLAQIVVQAGMDESSQHASAGRAVHLLAEVFPVPEFANWNLCESLLPHARTCANLIEKWSLQTFEAATLLNNTGVYLDDRGIYDEAITLYRITISICEKTLSPDHPNLAKSINNLATTFHKQGRHVEAEPLFERVLALRERALQPYHPDLATSLNNLASLYWAQTKYTQAEPLYKRALSIFESAFGQDHIQVAVTVDNLSTLYVRQGKFVESEELGLRALAIREKSLPQNHPDIAISLNSLGMLYKDQQKYDEAEPLLRRALDICEKSLGVEHPNTKTIRENLVRLKN